jgi:hypothetical protein
MLPLTRNQISKELLLAMTDDERTVFLGLTHAENEANALSKMLYWTVHTHEETDTEKDGRISMLLLIVLMLCVKLFEYWRLLENNFRTSLWRSHEPALPDDTRDALDNLRNYFGRRNPINIIRDQFNVHYPTDNLGRILPRLADPMYFYRDNENDRNNLYHFADVIWAQALETLTGRNLETLAREVIELTVWFSQVTNGLTGQILERYRSQNILPEPVELQIDALPRFNEVTLPWFTDMTGVVGLSID